MTPADYTDADGNPQTFPTTLTHAELVAAVKKAENEGAPSWYGSEAANAYVSGLDAHLDTLAALLHLALTAPNPMTQQLMRAIVADALTRMGAL